MTNRRQFLAGLAAGAGAAAIPGLVRAEEVPCVFKVCDIFLYSAPFHLDTFWLQSGPTSSWREEPDMGLVDAGVPNSPIPFLGSGQFGLPYDLAVGPAFYPFVGTALLDRMRLLVMHNDLGVHEVAASIALRSKGTDHPEAASIGAYIQGLAGATDLPVSYVVDANRDAQITHYATTTNPAATGNSLVIPMGSDAFIERLNRAGAATDPLLALYGDRYGQRLTHALGRVRSSAFDVYRESLERSLSWEAIYGLLSGYAPGLEGDRSFVDGEPNYLTNPMVQGVELAGYLFANGARHVTVLGGGSRAYPTFDTHDDFPGPDYVGQATRQNATLYGINKALRSLFDQGLLPLDRTIVRLFCEFGRRRDNDGSEHYPACYLNAVIGGACAARGVDTVIDFGTDGRGVSVDPLHPVEVNQAICIAAGLSADEFGTPEQTSALTTRVFGVDPTTLTCQIGIGGNP
jgi:hypothetical protein